MIRPTTAAAALLMITAFGCNKNAVDPNERADGITLGHAGPKPTATQETGPSQGQLQAPMRAPMPAPAPVAAASSDPATAEAQRLYATVCTTCHGATGEGNGQMAANLTPHPRNYHDATWQASVSDEDLSKTILLGGAATGKSMMMPSQPQLADKPQVLAALVKIIRGFGK